MQSADVEDAPSVAVQERGEHSHEFDPGEEDAILPGVAT